MVLLPEVRAGMDLVRGPQSTLPSLQSRSAEFSGQSGALGPAASAVPIATTPCEGASTAAGDVGYDVRLVSVPTASVVAISVNAILRGETAQLVGTGPVGAPQDDPAHKNYSPSPVLHSLYNCDD